MFAHAHIHTRTQVPTEVRAVRCPGAGVTASCKLPDTCRLGESNLVPQEEQDVLLTVKPFSIPRPSSFKKSSYFGVQGCSTLVPWEMKTVSLEEAQPRAVA